MKKILSIQSFVVHGHVGNSAATFPLMLMGNSVDPLNTVHFCNHSGYNHFSGEITSPDTIIKILKGLEINGFLQNYEYILLGYMGSTKNLECIEEFLYNFKKSQVIFLDPVMGDHGKLYLPADNIPIYKRFISIADIITPNGFEASLLSGLEITDLDSCIKICDVLHGMGPSKVVITSTELSNPKAEYLYLICSMNNQKWMIEFPKLDAKFSGTGDLFNALLLGYLPGDFNMDSLTFAGCVEKACNAIQNVLENSKDQAELAIVDSRDLMLKPKILFSLKTI